MSKQQDYLSTAQCFVCKKPLPASGDYVKCLHCGNRFHYSPCATLSESTYNGMTSDKKSAWKCHICRGERNRAKSPNNLYQEINYDDLAEETLIQHQNNEQLNKHNKRQRLNVEMDNEATFSSNENNNILDIKADLLMFKSSMTNNLNDIKTSIQQVNNNIILTNNSLREEMTNSYKKLTDAMSSIALQVSELIKENKEKETRLIQMENKVHYLEQKLIYKNIEIKNVNNENLNAVDVIKTIATSLNVEIKETDISNAYKIQKQDKVIVEFNSLIKKKELLSKIRGHKVNGAILKNNKDNTSNDHDIPYKPIYINEQLTSNNKRLLWLTKTKVKECGWKFVWVRDGNIYAKKNENATLIKIVSNSDIELIEI